MRHSNVVQPCPSIMQLTQLCNTLETLVSIAMPHTCITMLGAGARGMPVIKAIPLSYASTQCLYA